MERFETIAPEAMSAAQRRVVEAIMAGPRGGMRGPFAALLHSPELADRVQKLGEYIRFEGVLPRPLNELAILVTARAWRCLYEWHAHAALALKAGLDPAIIEAIAAGRPPQGMSRDEAAVYGFATELHERGRVSDQRFAAVATRFGKQGAIELVGACGYYSLVAMVLNTAEVPLPPGATSPFPPEPSGA